jgi:hypothetical protein
VTYFKQYGELRTGTNYLKRLIELNFKECTVFGSVLGWKHGTYGLTNCEDETKSHEEWILRKTRDGVVFSVDNLPLKHTQRDLRESLDNLKYIFSIKKPIPFIISYKKFRMPKRRLTEKTILSLCKRYNDKYATWLDMYRTNEDSSIVMPYESVILNYSDALLALELKFKLERRRQHYINESNTVKASTDVGLIIDKQTFNAEYYLYEKYLDDISQEHIDIIEDNINHTTVNKLYELGF